MMTVDPWWSPTALPRWSPGIAGGVPSVPVRADAHDYGARGDGGDDTAAIQAAIDAVDTPGAVFLRPGVYGLRQALYLRSGVVLRGAGPLRTHVRADFSQRQPGALVVAGSDRDGEPRAVIDGAIAGSCALTLEDTGGLRPGDRVALCCDNDPDLLYTCPRWNGAWAQTAVGQILGIAAVTEGRIVLDRPLRLSYGSTLRPRLIALAAIVGAGIEDLRCSQSNTRADCLIAIDRASDCWVRGCQGTGCHRAHVWITRSRGIEIRSCLMHHADDYGGGGRGYGVVAGRWATDCLVEDNAFDHLRHAMMTKEGANGTVFAYNASVRCMHNCDISIHGHYSSHNLFEGNAVQRIVYADFWGPTGPATTCFRNRIANAGRRCPGAAIEIRDCSHDAILLLNTLERRGLQIHGDCLRARVARNLFLAGPPDGAEGLGPGSPAPDWLAPASLYRQSKPIWWGDTPWPAIGADVDLAALRQGLSPTPIPAARRLAAHLESV